MWRIVIVCLGFAGFVAATKSDATNANSGEKSDSDVKSFVPDYDYIPDYSQYIPDYSQYIPDYSQYIPDYSQYIPAYSQYIPDYSQYIPDYSQYIPANVPTSDYDQYIPKYEQYQDVDKYRHFSNYMEHNHAPSSPEKCNTTAQLDAWRKRTEAPMKAFIPKEYRSFSTSPIEEKYEQNLKRIKDAQESQDASMNKTSSASKETQKTSDGPAEAPASDGGSIPPAAKVGDYDIKSDAAQASSSSDSKSPNSISEVPASDGGIFLAAKLGDYDFKSDTAQASASSDSESKSSDSKSKSKIPDFAHFVPNFKQYIPDSKQYIPRDYDKFIPDYEKYQDIKKYQDFAQQQEKDSSAKQKAPSSASKCTSMKELDAWRKATESPTRAFVPKMWRSFPMDAIDEEYVRNKKRIGAAEEAKKDQKTNTTAAAPPSRRLSESATQSNAHTGTSDYEQFIPNYAKYQDVHKYMRFAKFMQDAKAPASAQDCKTKGELDAWRAVREAPIKAFVPKRWQHLESIQQQYKQNFKRIQASQTAAEQTRTESQTAADQTGTADQTATAVPVELLVEDGFASGAKQFTPTRIQTPEVQNLVPSYAKHMDVQMFLSFASFIQEQHAPDKVAECKNMVQLNAWHKKQNAIINEFVPKAYQTFPAHALEKKYDENKRRIVASQNSTEKTETSSLQLAATASYVSSPLIALVAVMSSAVLVTSLSRQLRRESALEEHLLEPEALCAA